MAILAWNRCPFTPDYTRGQKEATFWLRKGSIEMSDYDFLCLSDSEFEILVRDLAEEWFGFSLQSYPKGRDGGIDCRRLQRIPRVSLDEEAPLTQQKLDSLIIQCKHYRRSGFDKLYNEIKNKEFNNILRLKPDSYVLATSVNISPDQEKKLLELIEPACQKVEVWGNSAINNKLSQFPDIERKHFKLWLTSTNVLQMVVNARIFNQSQFFEDEIKRKISRFVHTDDFSKALKILHEEHVCIISGIPGIGKTTLAQIIAVKFMESGYKITNASAGLDDCLSQPMVDEKRLYILDDFLGQNINELRFERNEDNRIVEVIRKAKSSKNIRIILTTREYILNYARTRSERLDYWDQNRYKLILSLSSYTIRHKAKILFNHLYFSNLPFELIQNLVKNRGYERIIYHHNFSPRLIEWMTEEGHVSSIDPSQYTEDFKKILDNPSRIWDHAFRNHIPEIATAMLYLLAVSKDGESSLAELANPLHKLALQLRMDGNAASDGAIEKALKILDGTFILTELVQDSLRIKFHNPSVRDFILSKLAADTTLITKIMACTEDFDSLEYLWIFMEEKSDTSKTARFFKPTNYFQNLITFFCSTNKMVLQLTLDTKIEISRPLNLYKRGVFLLLVAEAVNSCESLDIVFETIIKQSKRPQNFGDFVMLCKSIKNSTHLSEQCKQVFIREQLQNIIQSLKSFTELHNLIFHFGNDPDYSKLMDLSPVEIFETHYLALIQKATETDDLDFLENEIELLEVFAQEYNTDISSHIGALEELKMELEAARENDPDGYDDGDEYRESDAYISSGEMYEMFGSFND